MDLEFRKFTELDFFKYKKWFSDTVLKIALEDIDSEWLDHVLNDNQGEEWVVYLKDQLVCVIGLVYPVEAFPYYTISNLAVNPKMKRLGIASLALSQLFEHYHQEQKSEWRCYVESTNVIALKFFKSNGWKVLTDSGSDSEMICLCYDN